MIEDSNEIKQRSKCKVCLSPNRWDYEKLYYETNGNISVRDLEVKAKERGEEISYSSFSRHFAEDYSKAFFEQHVLELSLDQKIKEDQKEQEKTISTVEAIAANIEDLKDLIEETKSIKNKTPATISAITNLYNLHSNLLERLERQRSSLSRKTGMSQAEMYKIIFQAASSLCPKCREEFWKNLHDKLKAV